MNQACAPLPQPAAPRRVEKPWGYELVWAENEHYAGKILHIARGHQLSFQFHRQKDETIYLLAGAVEIDLAGPDGAPVTVRLEPGQSFRLRPGVRHRFRAVTASDLVEVSTPELDDVVRLADDYGRAAD